MLVWFSLNAESALDDGSLISKIHTLRFSLPYIVALIAIGWMLHLRHLPKLHLWQIGLIGYACVAIGSGLLTDHPREYLHFHTAILCCIAVTALGVSLARTHEDISEQDVATSLLLSGLIILSAVTALFFIRDVFHAINLGVFQGYDIQPRAETDFGMHTPRPTGNARSATIIGMALMIIYCSNIARHKLVYIAASFCVALLIFYQSRGSVLASLATVTVLGVVLSRDQWPSITSVAKFTLASCLLFAFIVGTILLGIEIADLWKPTAVKHANSELFRDFTPPSIGSGRLTHWHDGFMRFLDSPWVGYGAQADRVFLNQNVSSMIVYTLLSGGLVGLVFALVAIWQPLNGVYTLAVHKRISADKTGHGPTLAALAIFTFLSARGLFENSYSLFNIDFLLAVPAIWILSQSTGETSLN